MSLGECREIAGLSAGRQARFSSYAGGRRKARRVLPSNTNLAAQPVTWRC